MLQTVSELVELTKGENTKNTIIDAIMKAVKMDEVHTKMWAVVAIPILNSILCRKRWDNSIQAMPTADQTFSVGEIVQGGWTAILIERVLEAEIYSMPV